VTKLSNLVLATVLSASAVPSSLAASLHGAAGTLIVGVPNSEGLIIAADTRRTLNGISCDFGTKLYVPENLPFTVVGFTGLSSYQAVKMPIRDCSEVEQAPTIFNIETTVRNFFLRKPSPISEMDIKALAEECVASVTTFLVNSGPLIDRSALAARPSILTVVLAAYDPATNKSIVREIAIKLRSQTDIAADQDVYRLYSPDGQPDWTAFGQGAYLVEHVLNGVGRQFLSNRYKDFEEAPRIDAISGVLAVEVAKTLIEATSKKSELVKIPAGVGGHIDVYSLSKDGVKKIQ
jgi:hypothetical protein